MSDTQTPPAWVVALLSQKGGPGKSTMAMALAAATADSGGQALLVDVDPQATAVAQVAKMTDPGFDVLHELEPERLSQLSRLRRHDVIFVDAPGSLEGRRVLKQVVQHTHLGLLPYVDEPASEEPTQRTSALLAEHGVAHAAVLNRVDTRSGAQSVVEARQNLTELGVPYLSSFVRLYNGYPRSLKQGQTVYQWRQRYGAHMREDIGRVHAEVQRRLAQIAHAQGGGR